MLSSLVSLLSLLEDVAVVGDLECVGIEPLGVRILLLPSRKGSLWMGIWEGRKRKKTRRARKRGKWCRERKYHAAVIDGMKGKGD